MNKNQWIALSIALLVVLGIYQLPKALVSSKEKKLDTNKATDTKETNTPRDQAHSQEQVSNLSPEQAKKVANWKKSLNSAQDIEKKRTFADSIAQSFRTINRLDSAAYYYELVLGKSSKQKDLKIVGNNWYEAYRFAIKPEKSKLYGEKTREFYQKVLAIEPKDFEAKANMAMTYTTTNTQMQAVLMLREILAEDSKNELAIFNLGILAIESQQFEKAIQRFESLLAINPKHLDAKLSLAQSLLSQSDKMKDKKFQERATQILQEVAAIKTDSLQMYSNVAKEALEKIKATTQNQN